MPAPIQLRFESRLAASAADVWAWAVSAKGIRREMRPLLYMTIPRGLKSIDSVDVQPGRRLFRSYMFAFCIVPFDWSDLTLLELEPGRRFLEQSPMGSMRLWRHERWVEPLDRDDPKAATSTLTDQLTFIPRWVAPLTAWTTRKIFEHRHRVLRSAFGQAS